MKRICTSYVIRGMQFRTTVDTTVHLLEWSKLETPTPNDGENVEQQELSFISGGNANGIATLGDILQFLTKLYILYYTVQQLCSWYLPKGVEN